MARTRLLGQTLESLLFGVDPIDLTTFVQVAGAMIAVAALASFIPARRALRVDPLIAMRSD
jgi:putative ABC transport system permease protein